MTFVTITADLPDELAAQLAPGEQALDVLLPGGGTVPAQVGTGPGATAAIRALTENLAAAARRHLATHQAAAESYASELDRAQRDFDVATGQSQPEVSRTVETRLIPRAGIWLKRRPDGSGPWTWIPYGDLCTLEEAALDSGQEQTLINHGLAARRAGGGLARTPELAGYLASLTFPSRREGADPS